jgi:hypothetical protein
MQLRKAHADTLLLLIPAPLPPLACSEAVSCQLYDELVTLQTGGSSTVAKRRASTSASSPKPDTGALPWLYYQGQGYTKARDVGLRWAWRAGATLRLAR